MHREGMRQVSTQAAATGASQSRLPSPTAVAQMPKPPQVERVGARWRKMMMRGANSMRLMDRRKGQGSGKAW